MTALEIETPKVPAPEPFTDAAKAVAHLIRLYDIATNFLRDRFVEALRHGRPTHRIRAYYPEIRLSVGTHALTDSRLSFGHVAGPGVYSTTITRPRLFANYLEQQIGLLLRNHGVPVIIGASDTPMPVHFAVAGDGAVTVPQEGALDFTLRDVFDVPDLATTHDQIVNGEDWRYPDGSTPLAPFTAQRVDYSLSRLSHYTATLPDHFQNHVLFTNYQFYVDEFEA